MGRDLIRTWTECPPLGWTTLALPLRAVDGDTLDLALIKVLRARLVNCWAPESRTRDKAEKEIGLRAKAALVGCVETILSRVFLDILDGLPERLRHDILAAATMPEVVRAFAHALSEERLPRVHVLGTESLKLADEITMERFLADVWVSETQNLSDAQVEAGLAMRTRKELDAWRDSGWKRRPRLMKAKA